MEGKTYRNHNHNQKLVTAGLLHNNADLYTCLFFLIFDMNTSAKSIRPISSSWPLETVTTNTLAASSQIPTNSVISTQTVWWKSRSTKMYASAAGSKSFQSKMQLVIIPVFQHEVLCGLREIFQKIVVFLLCGSLFKMFHLATFFIIFREHNIKLK